MKAVEIKNGTSKGHHDFGRNSYVVITLDDGTQILLNEHKMADNPNRDIQISIRDNGVGYGCGELIVPVGTGNWQEYDKSDDYKNDHKETITELK